MNIHELDAASNNSVDDIRELCKQVLIPPQTGKYKVFIIDEVHMLSASAFNAFLKTLEEPPSYVIFVLCTTEKHKILPTILSRCQVYDFQRMTTKNTIDHLMYVADKEGYTAEPEALALIAGKQPQHQLLFLKSWNEWGEGNYVEPDLKYGHGYLKAIKNALDKVEHLG